jgi:Holliday junction DNA helicase RuvA
MISRIRGKVLAKDGARVLIDTGALVYEINAAATVLNRLDKALGQQETVELVVYHYLNIDGNRGLPVLIGFWDELERDFFEKLIVVAGVGPKLALKVFEQPVASIAAAIEAGDCEFLQELEGIGKQKARQIVASLQGKVGRFALLKEGEAKASRTDPELFQEARQVLARLGYNGREIEDMLKKSAAAAKSCSNLEDLLNEIYRQNKR